MLDISDQIRLALKNQEFNLPQVVQRAAHTFGRVRSPYLPQDDNLKTIFIHVPKAAGTSVRRALYDTKSFHIPAIRYQTPKGSQTTTSSVSFETTGTA